MPDDAILTRRWAVYDSWQVFPDQSGRLPRAIAVVPEGETRDTVVKAGSCQPGDTGHQGRNLAVARAIVARHNEWLDRLQAESAPAPAAAQG